MAKRKKSPHAKRNGVKSRQDIRLLEDVGLDATELCPDGEYQDEYLADMNLMMGNPLSKGILWKDYSELELQTLLKMHFEMMDYDTTWRHRDDPANEKGVDLEFNRKSDGRRVLVAVKKHPKKGALAQILELAGQAADERIYVYIGGAVQSFRDKLGVFRSKVQFWDERELESRLNGTGLTMQLKVANSKTYQAMFKIMVQLIDAIQKKPPRGPPSKPRAETLETLWGMKDRAVTTSKCATMAQLMLGDPGRFGELSHEKVQNLVVYLLDYIYAYGLMSLQKTFEDLSPELRWLLYYVHKKTKIRSNWLELFQYSRGPVPGEVELFHQEFEKDRAKRTEALRGMKSIVHDDTSAEPKAIHLEDAAILFRSLSIWADGLEGTIDDLYERCVRGNVRE